ncbi:RICIN domain-containing protein [Microbispora sp. NEAU-D428]|uniref:RICIN domain-containing protein n=1 Tax=Microbispora sitophila TaxID=2771537 RepID=UPI0018667670|nr:RICIN domain-containing protein [Microbispora sitophila]MBE3012821.1 RICIN domain-containing protein [Microbispora sitophila]
MPPTPPETVPSPPRTRRRTPRGIAAAAAVPLAAVALHAVPAQAAVPAAGGTYQISVTKSGMCLDIVSGSKDNGALVQQWGCTTGAAWQQFTLNSAGSGIYTLVNVNSGRCLDVPSGSTTSGTDLPSR